MFTSSDGQWLAAINCFGDVYIFNLEILRQHWFISRLDGASVTCGGFPPRDNNVLIITTSLNQFYIFDVEARQLGEWSMQHTFSLPRRYQEFPGEVIGLSFYLCHSPIHQNRLHLLFIVPGAVLIMFVLPCCSGLTCTFVMPYLYCYRHCSHILIILISVMHTTKIEHK